MNETLKTIATRYSCRNFTGEPLEETDLSAIAQAGIQAPSGMNRQGWQIIVVKDNVLIREMEEEGMKLLSLMEDKSLYERIMARGGKLFYNAPCMIILAMKEAAQQGAEWMDCGIVAQNIVLAATSLGIANVHCGFTTVAFAGDKAEEFKRRLKFPQGYECGIGILLGYATEAGTPHVPNPEKITVIE